MLYKIEFDVAAIIFMTILLCSCFLQKRFSTRDSKVLVLLVSDVILACIVNIAISFAMFRHPENIHINGTLSMLVALFANLCPALFYMFIHTTTHRDQRIPKEYWKIIAALLLIEIFAIFSTPFTHFLYTFNHETFMTYNFGYYLLFVAAFIYILLGVIEILQNRKKFSRTNILFLTLFSSTTIFLVAFQMKNPHMSTIGFACATAIFSAFLTLQSPGSYYDPSTGTLNKNAFLEVLLSFKQEHPGSVVIFKMTKTNKIKDLFGIEGRYFITRQFMDLLRIKCHSEKIFYLFNDTYIIYLNKAGDAENAGKIIRELTTQSLPFYPSQASKTIINYRITGRIFVVNDFRMLTQSNDGKTVYTTNETISLINYIALSFQPHHLSIIDDAIISAFQEQVRIKHLVENAIENKSFEVFMQPIFSLKENAFTGAEALLRLKDENGNYIPPLSFIPEAEANGDIMPISDIMIQKTCDFINRTRLFEKGIQTVNINLSMIQCMYEGIVDHICDILDRNKVSPTLIRFEITESLAANDEVRFEKLLDEMTERGIEYALDDYGTGYSNTSKILSHSFSEIKFDKSIIDSISQGDNNENAIRYLFDLTKEKKMISLAEGVENKETVEILKKIGCDMIQGFYFARPMNSEDFAKFLEENN